MATFTVTTLADEAFAGTETAGTPDGAGLSLREALGLAVFNGVSTPDTIVFDYSLTVGSDPGVDDGHLILANGELEIMSNVTINGDVNGDGKADITLDANSLSRVILMPIGTSTLYGLTITGGVATASFGGGINNAGQLTLINSTVTGNSAALGFGGGISSSGTLTTNNVLFSANTAAGGFGGALNLSGTANLTNTTFYANSADGAFGGAINNAANLTLTNVTVTGGTASFGGGIYNAATLTMTNTIIAGNTAAFGGDLNLAGGTVTLLGHNVLSGAVGGITTGTEDAVIAAITDIFQDTGTNSLGVASGVLADNGGPTQTVAIKAGGVAHNAANTVLPVDTTDADGNGNTVENLPIDARGIARQDGATVDIGAVELQSYTAPVQNANAGATVNEGASVTIGNAQLDFNDAEQSDAQIKFTLTSSPVNGTLFRNGLALAIGRTFSQADIVNNLISYTHNDSETTIDSFGFSVSDGFAPAITGLTFAITVTPQNDAPVITSNAGGATANVSVAENGAAVTTVAATDDGPSTTYTIIGGADAAKFQINATTGALAFGSAPNFEAPADADANNSYIVQVQASDGTLADTQTITVNVTDVNDAPVITSNAGGATANVSVAENGAAVTTVATTDDGPSTTYTIIGGADAAKFQINATTGALAFGSAPNFEAPADADANNSYIVQVQASDGTLADTQTITVNVTDVNDAPVITSNAGGATANVSVAENGAAVTTVATTDDGPSTTYTIIGGADAAKFQINATTGALAFGSAPNFEAPADADANNSYIVQVQASDGTLADTQTITVNVTDVNETITLSPGDDSFTAPAGLAVVVGGAGIDTVTFGFKLTDATVTYAGNTVTIESASSHTVLTGFEKYEFTDGTVNNNDGIPLIDDLFYYSNNHDVWNAHVDADAHFALFGRNEGRDPNAFFSTVVYRSANPVVAAAGVNPLDHFDTFGWHEGRVPSIRFDPVQYLAANPDVAAAGIDPLRHYLQFGYQEGRQPFAATELIGANGFDFVYYLNHNPDVAAAGVDPFQHFQTVGWQEGRNPNALFDTNGYLATYGDVAAAHVNPLDHYNTFGRHEGRDPSPGFDTTDYLAAYADVATALVNPLTHFLQHGIHEDRSPFADGVWG